MKVQVPVSLKYVTVAQWSEVQDILGKSTEEMFTKIKVISILCNLDFKIVSEINIDDIEKIWNQINLMFSKVQEIEHFELEGVKYGFIPDLETMTGAEYIDLENHLQGDIQRAMTVMYRPIKKQYGSLYSIEKYKGSDVNFDVMKNAPASAFLAASVFFSTLHKELLKGIPNYMSNNLTDLELQILEKNGVGISQLTQLLTAID